jgi:salicylate hydroxylase
MAVEDAAVLGTLLGQITQEGRSQALHQIPDMLQLYETCQKTRSTTNVEGAVANRRLYNMHDGPEQVARDKTLAEADFRSPSPWGFVDVDYQTRLLGFDCVAEAKRAFDEWTRKGGSGIGSAEEGKSRL